MFTIHVDREVSAPIDRVWNIVADIDNEHQYWRGLKAIKNTSKNSKVIEGEVRIGLRNIASHQAVVLNPKKSVEITITEGPVRGTRVVTLIPSGDNKTKICVSWDFKPSGIPIMFIGTVKRYLSEVTEEALNRIEGCRISTTSLFRSKD